MGLIVVIILIIILIYITHQDKKQEYNTAKQEIEQKKILYAKQGNRNILNRIGKEDYIKYVGFNEYEDIINNRDTTIYQMKEEYSNICK